MKTTLDFLVKVSDFFDERTIESGQNICFKHGVEHVGKTVYSIIIDQFLYEKTQDKVYLARALKRVRYIMKQTQTQDGTTIFAASDTSRNMSNGMIDGGAATDALTGFLSDYPDCLTQNEREVLWSSIESVCNTYLKDRVTIKCHTNQRLWGSTGLSRAYEYKKVQEWKDAVVRSVDVSIDEIRDDGSIPYVTDYRKNNYPVGINDTTTYYHSRHIAYAHYALQMTDALDDVYMEKMRPAVDFLMGMYQVDGVKNINFETKRWYFNSQYEVGSHAYDVYVFAIYYVWSQDVRYARMCRASFQALCDHQVRDDGGIRDHIDEVENFQCPYFWNSHCAWLTRVSSEIESCMVATKETSVAKELTYFKETDVVKVVNDKYACTIRGSKQPMSPQWGPRIGGGSLLYLGFSHTDYRDQQKVKTDHDIGGGNFYVRKQLIPSLKYWVDQKRAFRSLAYYVWIEFRAWDFSSAAFRLRNLIAGLAISDSLYTTQFCHQTTTKLSSDKVQYISSLANMAGNTLGSDIERTYFFQDDGFHVTEIYSSKTAMSGLRYKLLAGSEKVEVSSDCEYTTSNNRIYFKSPIKRAAISYFVSADTRL